MIGKQEIIITTEIKGILKELFTSKKYTKIGVLVDENTRTHCYPLIIDSLPKHNVFEIKSGEEEKELSTCEQIWLEMTNAHFDRNSLLINLGGGVIGDMGGFCASTFKRGIEFINLPTTLLSQVDASVGGKLGIDFHGFKNHIGVFQEPRMVLIDPTFLETLDPRELRSGFAEVIKHSLIRDKTHWLELTQKELSQHDWSKIIEHSINIKKSVVASDPLENGLRKILNFGHTIGHAIESYYLKIKGKRLLHGEAIAIGMIAESFLSEEKLSLSKNELIDIQEFIIKIFGAPKIDNGDLEKIVQLTYQDKKNTGKIINGTLLSAVGSAEFDIPLQPKEIEGGLKYYQELTNKN
ncbi:3-dehydroquinate synthase [Fulvivirgaceae bacterium BMA10]|uniref:3-dehydroquinate synthase n=1 Tax=Splendidivirga corallicola TaxID=3051826 RepID=A0ABT8KUN6_9BACT|nr:3-dehydroquinate synthase [Fulvivirgaceae bacterium BMA10]